MPPETYNGWTNYETWAVGMFLDGNYTGEGTYREVLELVEHRNGEEDNPTRTRILAEDLKDYVEQKILGDDAPATLATDLLGTTLSEVNWHELAESKLSELTEA